MSKFELKKGQTNHQTCPICGKPEDKTLRPFCSNRCANVDLNRWLKGTYAIPAGEHDEETDT